MFTATREKDDLSDTKKRASDDLHSGIHRVASDVYETASATKDDVTDMARNLGGRFRDIADSAEHATETVTTKIRENPIPSSLIALGVGFMIGSLFRR